MSSSDLGQATYFARRVLFEEGGACLAEFISEEIRGALSHYFWQFATAMYNVSRPEDAANFMDLLLRPQMKFLESKSDTAIEAQGDATDVNALTLLAELYAQRRNVAEAIHVMDTLENRLRVQSRWPASPSTFLKTSYTRLRCHLIEAGAGVGTGIISNADALCATNCLHAMLEYAANNCRRALIDTNTIGFKVLAASCREYVRAVGISEAATFRDSFERLHATCCKASQDGASSCTQEINVLLLDSVLPLIERTSWEAVSSHKGVEAYLLGVIRNVGEYADNYPSSIPRKQLLITTLWRYACAMREARHRGSTL